MNVHELQPLESGDEAKAPASEADRLVMPCTRHRVVLDRKWAMVFVFLGFVGLLMFILSLWAGESKDWFGNFLMLWVGIRLLPLMLLPFLPFYLRHAMRSFHVFERDQAGHVTLEKQWHWHGRIVRRKPVDLSSYTWLRVKAPDFVALTLELGNRKYLTYPLEVVRPVGQNVFLPEQLEADKARLVETGATVAAWMGIEDRGFRPYS